MQDIREIECLEVCVHLEKLYLVENSIRKIKGLDHLRSLKELYLYSNRITKIENLQTLTQLEVGGVGECCRFSTPQTHSCMSKVAALRCDYSRHNSCPCLFPSGAVAGR